MQRGYLRAHCAEFGTKCRNLSSQLSCQRHCRICSDNGSVSTVPRDVGATVVATHGGQGAATMGAIPGTALSISNT